MNTDLNNITNENGGGLSTAVTGKYTSVRHERAMRDADKMTGGQVAAMLRKHGHSVKAHDLVDIFRELIGGYPEWHHSGFHSKGMGRTYFYTTAQAEKLLELMPTLEEVRAERMAAAERERQRKAETMVQGVAYQWVKQGKRNVKKLTVYSGSLLGAPKGLVPLDADHYAVALEQAGRIYTGWDEPTVMDFDPEAWAEAKKAKEDALVKAEAERAEREAVHAKEAAERMEEARNILAGVEGKEPVQVFRAWRAAGYCDPTGTVTALKNALGISWSQVRYLAKS